MIRVKICGLTNLEDALLAVKLGATALGFIFYRQSPRFIPPSRARAIRQALPPFVTTVGVFVDEPIEEIIRVKDYVGLDFIQLHGKETPEVTSHFYPKVIKAFRLKEEGDLEALLPYRDKVSAFLLDTYVKGMWGGTGKTFDWSLALKAKELGVPIILAGGLSPSNVRQAIKQVKPYALDVSSGVEVFPGRKHPALLRELFAKIKGIE